MLDSESNMAIVQLIIGILVIILVKFITIKTIYNRFRVSNLTEEELKFDAIRPIYKKLKLGENPKTTLINKYAKSIKSRALTYYVLNKFDKIDLFPKEVLTIEKLSESYLANWLNMNDDYDSFPNEIIYENTIEIKNKSTFLVFKFLACEPHAYAEKGWLKGYVGYIPSEINSFLNPAVVTSNFRNEILMEIDLEKLI